MFRGAAELLFVLRGRSLTAVAVIAGFAILSLGGWLLVSIGGVAAVVIGLCLLALFLAAAFATRKSAEGRIVRNMSQRDNGGSKT